MNANFEFQHLAYVNVRPFLRKYDVKNIVDPWNPYTRHLSHSRIEDYYEREFLRENGTLFQAVRPQILFLCGRHFDYVLVRMQEQFLGVLMRQDQAQLRFNLDLLKAFVILEKILPQASLVDLILNQLDDHVFRAGYSKWFKRFLATRGERLSAWERRFLRRRSWSLCMYHVNREELWMAIASNPHYIPTKMYRQSGGWYQYDKYLASAWTHLTSHTHVSDYYTVHRLISRHHAMMHKVVHNLSQSATKERLSRILRALSRSPYITSKTLLTHYHVLDWDSIMAFNPNAPFLPTVQYNIKSVLKGPNAIAYDYSRIRQHMHYMREELIARVAYHPSRIQTWLEGGRNLEEYVFDS